MVDKDDLLPVLVNDNQVIPYLKMYLTLTGQWFPYKLTSKLKKGLYALWQFLICYGVGAYFVYSALYVWGVKYETIVEYYLYYPITTIERATWEFRWLITCYIGIMVYNNAIREGNYFVSKSAPEKNWCDRKGSVFSKNNDVSPLLSDERWKEARNFLLGLGVSLILLWLLSITCNLSEIDFNITSDNIGAVSKYVILKFLDRFFTFPLFAVLCVVIFVLGSMVEQYCEEIKTWSRVDNGREKARKRFGEIKASIRSATLSFQLYLFVHFLLLLVTFFLGVCSCFEQLEVQISQNVTLVSPLMIPRFSGITGFAGNVSTVGSSTGSPLMMDLINGMHRGLHARNASSESPAEKSPFPVDTIWLKRSMKMIAVEMVMKTCESLLLYLVPVVLMARLEKQLRLVVEAIEDSDCEYQEENAYLFSNTNEIRIMCKYIKTATGLKVFGYSVPKFQAFILVAFGPFFAVIIRLLLLHEISIGILGNMACQQRICADMSNREKLIDVMLMVLESRDAPTLIEVTRLLHACVSNAETRDKWIDAIQRSSLFNNLMFILENSLNDELLLNCSLLLSSLLKHSEGCQEIIDEDRLSNAVMEAIRQTQGENDKTKDALLYLQQLISKKK